MGEQDDPNQQVQWPRSSTRTLRWSKAPGVPQLKTYSGQSGSPTTPPVFRSGSVAPAPTGVR